MVRAASLGPWLAFAKRAGSSAVEHSTFNRMVVGSIPTRPTTLFPNPNGRKGFRGWKTMLDLALYLVGSPFILADHRHNVSSEPNLVGGAGVTLDLL
jgi:hypothetical protein